MAYKSLRTLLIFGALRSETLPPTLNNREFASSCKQSPIPRQIGVPQT